MNRLASTTLRTLCCFSLLVSGCLALAAENPPAETNTAEQTASLLAARASYEQSIAAIEQHNDAYSAELGDAYYGLGSTLQALGEDEAANTALRKSLQALRTSFGLQSLKQLPTLQALVKSCRTLAKWDEVDALHSLIYHISTRQFEAGNDTRLQAALQLGNWKLEAASKELLPKRDEPAAAAIVMLQKEIGQLKAAKSQSDKNLPLAALYLQVAAAELLEARRAWDTPLRDYDSNGEKETAMEQQCDNVRGPDGKLIRVCTVVEVSNAGNYLQAKSQTKDYAIAEHVFSMRDSINHAVQALRSAPSNTPAHRKLQASTADLIKQYNDFLKSTQETTTSRIAR